MDANVKNKVKQALYGITISDDWHDISGVSSTSESYYKPPSYMIKMALEILYGGRLPSGYDKSAWQIPILFHNNNWLISDWKNSTWSINTRIGTKKEAEILFRKFELTSKILDKYVRSQAKKQFENENISLNNRFEKSLQILKHFIQKLQKSVQDFKSNEYQSLEVGETLSKAFNRIRWEARQEVEIYTITTSIFFFSHTEVIFDACFSLTDRKGLKYKEFRALEWSDKFKFFIAPSSDSKINSLFSDLLGIKKYYRNIPVHSSPEFLFPLENYGLLVASYENLYLPHMEYSITFDVSEGERILNTITNCLSLLMTHENTMFGYLYAESGTTIHIKKEFVEQLKIHMTSLNEFTKELKRRAAYQDAINNGDIV